MRIHMWETIIEIMQAAMDPIPLYEDDPAMHRHTGIWDQLTRTPTQLLPAADHGRLP